MGLDPAVHNSMVTNVAAIDQSSKATATTINIKIVSQFSLLEMRLETKIDTAQYDDSLHLIFKHMFSNVCWQQF